MPLSITFGGISALNPTAYNVPTGNTHTLLIAYVSGSYDQTVGQPIQSLAFGGIPMTLANIVVGPHVGAGIDYLQIWYLANPPAGSSQNFTYGAGTGSVAYAAHYLNAVSVFFSLQSVSGIGNNNPVTVFLNNNFQTNAWGFTAGYTSSIAPSPSGTGLTSRANNGTGGQFFYDTNGTFTGLYEIDFQTTNAQAYVYAAGYIIPYTPPSVTDTTVVTDSVQIQLNPVHINVSETTIVSDTVAGLNNNSTPLDILATLVSSSYKWLTATLLAAQQAFAVRPYFTVQIIDDTIQPNATLFSGTGNPLNRGAMAVGPDGAALAAGFDGSGHVSFWKAPDLNAVAGVWPTQITLDTGGNLSPSTNQVSISASGWFNGSYQIDIWYYGNLGVDGSNVLIFNQFSTDGGVTWTKRTFNPASMPNTNYPNDNLSIAAMQTRNVQGVIYSGCFYIKPNGNTFGSGFVGYDVYYIWGNISGFTTDAMWAQNNANAYDWTIHSISAFYLNGTQSVVFSGFHNVFGSPGSNQNFSLWVSSILNIQGTVGADLWSTPVSVMPLGSTNTLNQNEFINPVATVFNSMVYIVFEAILVDSVSQTAQNTSANVVTLNTNYMLIQSDDANTFSYPSIMISTTGVQFSSGTTASFIQQGGYWYLGGGNGWLWQYVQNAIVADISADTIGYSIQEQAGQPGSINLQIANANNKWFGASPTGSGAAAIARNRKICVWQGYYNSSGIPEAVPHSVFFIDDIQNQISGTTNNLTIVGRDLYKKMITTTMKFNYQFIGPTFYIDIFDGTTNNNWNQIAGVWNFQSNINAVDGLNAGSEATMVLNNVQINTFGHTFRVFFLNTATGTAYVYGMYVDSNNWLRLEIDTFHSTWAVVINVATVKSTLNSGSLPSAMTNGQFYMVLVKRYAYWNFNFIFSPTGGGTGNELATYAPTTQSAVLGTGGYAIASTVAANTSLQGAFTVGLGASASQTQRFKYLQLEVYNNSNNTGEVTRSFARLAGIFSFKIVNTFRELFFTTTQLAGVFSAMNRVLFVQANQQAGSTINQMSNGEIQFQTKITLVSAGSPAGFRFMFRANNPTGQTIAYYFHLLWNGQTGTASAVTCRFERLTNGITYQFYNSAEDVNFNASFSNTSTLNFDPSIFHTFRIVMIDGQMFAFIDNTMVAAWNDDNANFAYISSGYWGFLADTNANISVQKVTAPILWKPVPSTTINPGDEVQSDISALANSLLFWYFSDLFGRFKTIFLSSTDPSTYTYNSQLYQQNVDQSDKEYIAQVTVQGTGVSATVRNTNLMAGVITRDLVVVDYTILTQTDAQTLAQNTLTNANQYINQNESTQVINVGAELFDVVTVVNTGNNTSGVNGPTRVYDNAFSSGGGNNNSDYSLTIDTGNI